MWCCDNRKVVCLRCAKRPMRLIHRSRHDNHLVMMCESCRDVVTIQAKKHPDVQAEHQHGIEDVVPRRELRTG